MADKVIVALPERSNEFQVMQASDAEAAGARLGLDLEIVQADGNAIQQIQQLFKVLRDEPRPRALVVEPVASEGMERVAHKAAETGVGWAILNCTAEFVERLRREFPRVAVFAVGSDQVEIGRLQGRQMKLLLPRGGTALFVEGPQAVTAARERRQGLEEALRGSGIQLVVLDAQWTEESAAHAVRQWLRLKTSETTRIALVAGQDDSMARGARQALESAPELAKRVAGVPFLGIDGVPEVGQRLVREGQLTATVVMPSNTGPALEAVAGWLRSGQMPPAAIRVPVRSYPEEAALRRA